MRNRTHTRAFIALALCGHVPPELYGLMPSGPSSVCFADGDGDGNAGGGGADDKNKGGGGGDDEKPTLTQKQFDAALDKRFAKVSKEHETKLAAAVKTEADKAAALQKQLDEITAKLEDAGKSDTAKEAAATKRALDKATSDLAEITKARDEAVAKVTASDAKLKSYIGRDAATKALTAAKCLPAGLSDAVDLFLAQAKVEVEVDEESGDITYSATVDKKPFDDLGKAAIAWLEQKPHLRSGAGGGTGTKNGGGGKPGLTDDDMDPLALFERGFAQQAARRG